ncbi:MAG TPA: endonuclease III [Verrucomicrobiae bacterium]|jgi:endonuclease-3
MARESFQITQQRTLRIIRGLEAAYPDAHCELTYTNPLQLLVATILSAQCTDKQVNIVTPDLFKKYRSAEDYAQSPAAEFETAIRRIGLYRNKAKNIQAACRKLVEEHRGIVPRTMEQLLELPGVGRKTANVVLGNAYNISVGIVVDTHVARLSERLRLTRHKAPEKIEADLQKLTPPDKWTVLSHLLIWHGRRRCFARNPDCAHCEIFGDCPTGQKILKENRDGQ